DRVEAAQPAYREFWAALARGEAQNGTFRRIDAAGQDVWITASYTPIRGPDGKVCKVVEYARDISEQLRINVDNKGQIDAIRASQAVIQFGVDGTVLEVNPRFLNVVGYTLEQIQGRHHRFLVDPIEADHLDYARFWQALARGEAQAGEFRRIGAQGREIWIQATYTPIRDSRGHVCKVVKYATDITASKHTLLELDRIIAAVGQGDLDQRADLTGATGDNLRLRQNINRMLDAIKTPLDEVSQVMAALGQRDLSTQVRGDYQGSMEMMKQHVNLAVRQLNDFMLQVQGSASLVRHSAEELAQASQTLGSRSEEQAASLEETAAAMEELSTTVEQNAANARLAEELAREASTKAVAGGEVVREAIGAMAEINASSRKISDIITVIDEIAFQTNLLALNAAVEAARAGDQGRGFAVVADEVRNLAGRSAVAAKEIKGLIADSTRKVEQGSLQVNRSGETLDAIVGAVKRVSATVSEIMAATLEQSNGIEMINQTVQNMDGNTQHNATLVEELAASGEQLREQAGLLNSHVESFAL
ncbi:MAG TPA: methyl-accepting chemotaxis protein, partial [Hyphomicrobiales bacterium]|nr:methyl-accepting chemotaxis protein [Hyphomicrobiales bacterium]